jgi:multidrug efflux pump subunit AcrB
MMASRLLRSTVAERHGRAFAASTRFYDGLVRAYDRALSWVLDHAGLMQAVTVGAAALSVVL